MHQPRTRAKALALGAALAAFISLAAAPASAREVGVSIQISQPGVYGRVDIGRFPQPQVVVQRPVVIVRPAGVIDSLGAGLVIGLWAGEGLHIESSPGAVIRRNVITRFHQGIAIGKFDGLLIDGNTIANLRTSGIVGVPGNNVTITGNGIGASFPWRWNQTPAGDHGDKIHLWSAGGNVSGLTITDNVLDDGAGVAILGLFIQNKNGNFANVTIERNTIRIGQTLAMMLTGTNGSVSFNTLVPLSATKPASIYSSFGNSGIWRGNTGGKGVVFNRKLTAAQKALVTVLP